MQITRAYVSSGIKSHIMISVNGVSNHISEL